MKLNLGAGAPHLHLPGYENWDRKTGQEIFPLDVPDGSCEEIRASHVLEHFSHAVIGNVLEDWTAKLAPGGCLKIAVPDFERIAKDYLDGKPIPMQSYIMGSHKNEDDHHGAVFDREGLAEVMMGCGLERVGAWTSEIKDCAALPISLNLLGYKPATELRTLSGVVATLSAPRYGPTLHQRCASRAFTRLGIPYSISRGAYWHQVLSETMEAHIAEPGVEFILTLDYDTVFSPSDVVELYRLMRACPEADVICPVQSKRHAEFALFGILGADGKPRVEVSSSIFDRLLTPITTGHFGLTMIRAESLRKLPRPWMMPAPSPEGRWGDHRVDADIAFWLNWKKAGMSLHLANRVVIGHLQEVVTWPGHDFKPVYQQVDEFEEAGIPAGVRRE